MHPGSIATKVKVYINLISLHLYKPTTKHRRESSSTAKWSPPPVGTVMVNSDAAIFAASNSMGFGIVIRDHNGSCLAACGEHVDGVTSPEMAEVLALRSALSFAVEEGFGRLLMASDCLSVIQRVSSSEVDRSALGAVTEDIKRLACLAPSCSFIHVFRGANALAHYLARACEYSGVVSRGVAPDCIQEQICKDIMVI